ncbi:MAG: hypothetical protein J1E01_06745 [Acetatifactor sp.]|nr:hypothetical protein [Acetatifactor sp.]
MDLKYWKQFESSGRIEDYLAFVSSVRREAERGDRAKESGHAGVYMGDGNHTEAESGGRVRQAYQPFN